MKKKIFLTEWKRIGNQWVREVLSPLYINERRLSRLCFNVGDSFYESAMILGNKSFKTLEGAQNCADSIAIEHVYGFSNDYEIEFITEERFAKLASLL